MEGTETGYAIEAGPPGPASGNGGAPKRKLDADPEGLPKEAFAIGRETMPFDALVSTIKNGDPTAIIVDAADGPRLLRRGADQESVQAVIERAIDQLGGAPVNGGNGSDDDANGNGARDDRPPSNGRRSSQGQ